MQLLKGTHQKSGSLFVLFLQFLLLSLFSPILDRYQHDWFEHPHHQWYQIMKRLQFCDSQPATTKKSTNQDNMI
jgi:hypothetical protein